MEPACLVSMPKVLLHEHLDGGLREQTLLDLLAARGLASPATDAAALGRWFDARVHAGSLVEYLRGFDLTVAAMATPEGLERVAFEAAEDALADGCVLAEFRIAPLLFEAHGLSGDEAVRAMLAGLRRSALPSGLIVCAMRHLSAVDTLRAAQLAIAWHGRGVVGFDLAGAEVGHPPGDHAQALAAAREAGLPLTLHAGEADAAERVVEAARMGATRIGHGVRLADALADPTRRGLVDEALQRGLHLEICPSSNVHTGAAESIEAHPVASLWRAGLSVGINTDNRLMSRTRLSHELALLRRHTALGDDDLTRMQVEAARHSFLPAVARDAAESAVQAWRARAGI